MAGRTKAIAACARRCTLRTRVQRSQGITPVFAVEGYALGIRPYQGSRQFAEPATTRACPRHVKLAGGC